MYALFYVFACIDIRKENVYLVTFSFLLPLATALSFLTWPDIQYNRDRRRDSNYAWLRDRRRDFNYAWLVWLGLRGIHYHMMASL